MEDNDDFMDIVAKLNEDYRKFMSDYCAFCQVGESQLADNLHRTWNRYLVRREIGSENILLKSYIAGLRDTTDKFVARTKENGSTSPADTPIAYEKDISYRGELPKRTRTDDGIR